MILTKQQSKVWYKEPWPWLLMAGPAIVVVAGFITFYLAQVNAADLVSDDYYKDGKHIDIQLHRDEEALKRHITAQVLVSPDNNAAKVLVSGDFDAEAVKAQLQALFAGWKSPKPYAPISTQYADIKAKRGSFTTPDKPNAVLLARQTHQPGLSFFAAAISLRMLRKCSQRRGWICPDSTAPSSAQPGSLS